MASHREFVPSQLDPAKVAFCAARSTQEDGARLILRFWAQSMIQGPVDILKEMGGLTSDSTAWSKVRLAGWLDMEVSGITCKNRSLKSMWVGFRHYIWLTSSSSSFFKFASLHSSYSWWLESGVNSCVWNTLGFHVTHNSTDNLICGRQNRKEKKKYILKITKMLKTIKITKQLTTYHCQEGLPYRASRS